MRMALKNRRYLKLIVGLRPADRLPSVTELLEEIQATGLKIGVASGSSHVRVVLDCVDVWVDGKMVARSKPAPDTFLMAAQFLEALPPPAGAFTLLCRQADASPPCALPKTRELS